VVFLQGGGDFSREIRDRALDAYAQDTYKVTSNLTLNLGLRYELPFPSTENQNRVNLFVPGTQSKVVPNAPAGLLYPGDPGVPGGLIPTQATTGENDLAQNPFNLAAERGPSMFDARNRLVLSYQWSLPFLQHSSSWYGKVLGNWQLNGIFTAMSGTPFTVFDSNDVSLQGQVPEITGFSANRPNVIGNPNSGPRTPQEWFNVSAFQQLQPDPKAGSMYSETKVATQSKARDT
jgi:hypothetical protein